MLATIQDFDPETGEVKMISEKQLKLVRNKIFNTSNLKQALRFFFRNIYPRRIFQMTQRETSKILDILL